MPLFRSPRAILRVLGMAVLALAAQAQAQVLTPDGAWTILPDHLPATKAQEAWIRPTQGLALDLNLIKMDQILSAAPREFTPAAVKPLVFELPDPSGQLQKFALLESPIMEQGLADQFPTIRTFVAQGLSDPTATLRADVTLHGFHAQVLSVHGDWYIDPFSRLDTTHYSSYYRRHLNRSHDWTCLVHEQRPNDGSNPAAVPVGTQLRTFRLANACTGEYAAFHGGTVPLAQSAIVTAINRVTGVYERDLAIRLTLVASNTNVVYTNAATDPYTNTNGGTMLGENQARLDTAPPTGIGSGNYDIGHVFSTGGGGVAGLGVVCLAGNKARGVTGSGSPTGDAFWIDYVAHEMGHQFGANHTFNSSTSNCGGGNRSAAHAYEIGSGSTIMAYAGICGADDLQTNSDAYMNWDSFEAISNYVASGSGTCSTSAATGNSIPSVSATGGFTIPIGTPFQLVANGSDANGDALTYCWEEADLGASTTVAAADNGTSPINRSFNPTTSNTRYIPALANILSNTTDIENKLPAVARAAYAWRCYVRDNRVNGGGVSGTNISLAVSAAAGPFAITSQNSTTTWLSGSLQTITWSVNNTTAAPINAANVNILLSTDGGNTFPITLVANTPNDGTQAVTIPNNLTTTGRIKIIPTNNIFFDINNANITINPGTGVVLSGTGVNTIADNVGNGNSNSRIDPGETAIQLSVQLSNTGPSNATGVSATLVSNTPTVTVTTATSAYPNLVASGGVGLNSTPYVLNVSASHACGNPISLTLNITSAQGTGTYNFTLPTGLAGGPGSPVTVSYSGPAVAIPDNLATGASANLAVSGFTGTIADLNFRIDGSVCNATNGSTTVGLDHTWVGDLTLTLQSPTGTIVTIMAAPGGTNNSGTNFCNTILDDEAASPIQSITIAGNPYTGSFTPNAPLTAFDGQNPNGTWILKAVDAAAQDSGNIRAFSLIITPTTTPTCTPPISGCTSPTITTNPTSQTVCAGTGASFTTAATGTAPLSFQWRKNTANISGATSAIYSIASTVVGDAGSYDCVVTNACGNSTTTAATLTVNTTPSISGNPAPLIRCTGTSATFSVTASGTPAPTYQWRKNASNIAGATSSSYTIASVVAGDAANYDCVVTNVCAVATSSSAALTVNTAPSISSQPIALTRCTGTSATFSVTAGGTPAPTFQWRKNTVNIPGATSNSYTIASVAGSDAANYDCVVTNSCSSATSNSVALTVQTDSAIITQPIGATRCPGDAYTLSVVASGNPAPNYQWRKNTVNIPGATGSSLAFPSLSAADAGSYDCVVNNPCGGATSNVATLTIQSGASITTQPSSQTVTAGASASFSVVASGSPTLSYAWRKNTVNLSNGGNISGANTATLTINPAVAGDAGSYDCVVTNPCGSVTTNDATLTISPACITDVDDGSFTGTPDGGTTIDDLLYYLFIFESGDIRADVDDGSGTGTLDGGLTIDDLLYYLFRFEQGC